MNGCLLLLLAPLGLFVSHPFLAFLPAALFLVYYIVRRPAAAEIGVPGQVRWSLVTGLVWVAYGLYEIAMFWWSRSIAGAPIRVDLFLVLPVLYLLTATALWSSVSFEISGSKEQEPLRPFTPGRYTRTRNRRFVIGFAIALAAFPLLNLLFRLATSGARQISGPVISLLVVLALAFFLVQGERWARWILLLWFGYSILNHVIGWSSLGNTGRHDLGIYRTWHLVSLVLAVLLGGYLLVSRRLKEHLAVAGAP